MFQVIEKEKGAVLVKMDIDTYKGLQSEINEENNLWKSVEVGEKASDVLSYLKSIK